MAIIVVSLPYTSYLCATFIVFCAYPQQAFKIEFS